MKKYLISALVAAMCLGIAGTVLAATPAVQPAAFSDIAGNDAEGELTLLGAMGIFTGDSGLGGAVKPDDPLTRAQFCKVVVSAMGRSSTAAGLAGLQPTFTDGATIPTWAWGYVNVAVYMGIINGYADGSFGANNPVTYAEAVTMLIRAVSGHAAQVGAGVWPYNFMFYGVDNGFTGGVDVGFANMPCTRGDMARMLVATMQIDKLDSKGVALPGTAVLYEGYEEDGDHLGNVYTGVVDYFDSADFDVDNEYDDWTLDFADKYWVAGAEGLAGLMNQTVFAVTDKDGNAFAVWATDGKSNVVTGVVKDVWGDADNDGDHDCIVLEDGTKVPYDEAEGDLYGTVNNESDNCLCDLDEYAPTYGQEIAITVGDDGLAVNFVATEFDTTYDGHYDFIEEVAPSEDYDATDDTTWTEVDLYEEDSWEPISADCRVTINGVVAKADDLQENDVVQYAYDWSGDFDYNIYILRAFRQVVEGTVAGTTTSYPGDVDKVTINLKAGGTKTYTLSHDCGISTVLPLKDAAVKYGLDFDGTLLVPIDFEEITPYVVCTSFVVNGDGTQSATFDVRGVSVTYKVNEILDLSGNIGDYLALYVDTSDNMVDDFDVIAIGTTKYEVVGVDKTNGTMTLSDGGDPATFSFVADDDTVIYKVTDEGDKVFVGFDGISAGTWLLWNPTYPVFEVTTEPL